MRTEEPLRVGGVVIREVDYPSLPTDDIRALNVFDNILDEESHPDDPPVPVELTDAEARNIPEFIRFREFWGRDPDGSIVSIGYGSWRDTEENRHLVNMDIRVRPDRRRRGIATALLRLVTEVAETEGRRLLTFGTSDRVPAGVAFAEALGAEAAFHGHTNRLLLSEVDRELVGRWIAEGPVRAAGYGLAALDGPYPDDLVEAIADLQHVMNTAPRDDLEWEDFVVTVDQIRAREKSMLAQGTERWSLYARHEATGELVGYTEVFWNPKTPNTIWQGDTGVRPEHRGHALGKWLKADMLRRILDERTEALDIRTGNADSNDAMLGINHALGFKPYLAATLWQIETEKVRAYLGPSR